MGRARLGTSYGNDSTLTDMGRLYLQAQALGAQQKANASQDALNNQMLGFRNELTGGTYNDMDAGVYNRTLAGFGLDPIQQWNESGGTLYQPYSTEANDYATGVGESAIAQNLATANAQNALAQQRLAPPQAGEFDYDNLYKGFSIYDEYTGKEQTDIPAMNQFLNFQSQAGDDWHSGANAGILGKIAKYKAMGSPDIQSYLAQKNDLLTDGDEKQPDFQPTGPRGNALMKAPDGKTYRSVQTIEDRNELPPADEFYYNVHDGQFYPNPNYEPNFRHTGRLGGYGMEY